MCLVIFCLFWIFVGPFNTCSITQKQKFCRNTINTFYMNHICCLCIWSFLVEAPLNASHLPLHRMSQPSAQEAGESHTSHTRVQTHTHTQAEGSRQLCLRVRQSVCLSPEGSVAASSCLFWQLRAALCSSAPGHMPSLSGTQIAQKSKSNMWFCNINTQFWNVK